MSERIIGRPMPIIDAVEKVSGATVFINDLELPGALVGKALRSPHPHARILNIDTSRAERLPGVAAVLSRNNTPEAPFGINIKDEAAFCREKVRYEGDEVAAVAAVDEDTAREALSLIEVEYEVLPSATDPFAALEEGAPIVHDYASGNIANQFHIKRGEIDEAFKNAEAVFSDDFHTHFAHQAYIEPTGCAARWHPDGRISLWGCLQSVFLIPTFMLSPVMGMPAGKFRVTQTKPGGAFGGKLDVKAALMAAMLSRAAQKPVRFILSLEEDLVSMRPRMPVHISLESAWNKNGALAGKRVKIVAENGAYCSLSPAIMSSIALRTDNLYKTPAAEIEGKLVYTNVIPSGQMRGFGNVQATYSWESHLDNVADGLGIDPAELRLKNYVETGDLTIHGWKIESCAVADATRYVVDKIDWKAKREQGGKGRGVGLASCIHVTGNKGFSAALGPDGTDPSSGVVRIDEEGQVEIWSGESDLGQGATSVMAYIASEVLGIPVARFKVPPTDTGYMPYGLGAFASRITLLAGNAVKLAAEDARKNLLEAAAEAMEIPASDLEIVEGEVMAKSLSDRSMPVGEVVRKAGSIIEGSGKWLAGGDVLDDQKYGNPSTTYSFSTHAAEVDVDMETGVVTVLQICAGHDPGRVINRLGAEGQVEGGVVQGMSYSMMEGLAPDAGHVRGRNFHDYLIATSMDIPPVEHEFFESMDPHGPYGAKGLAEVAINPITAAICNAIYHATGGARIHSLPISPERVLEAIDEVRAGS
ncbi:MAG TPA: 4-hydroxybenzoyl-CoA reductase [Nitrospinae bacterium]|nr:4-hydroxybenzoyl-CoA reductase [Nitrospinota bacterium]